MKYLAHYHELLCTKLNRQFDSAELLDAAMTVSLPDSEVDAARRHALLHAADYF